MKRARHPAVIVRAAGPDDALSMIEMCSRVYPDAPPWTLASLASHHRVFPEGQLVAVNLDTGELLGYALSLIVDWDDYGMHTNWATLTDNGYFTNHAPATGRTLYGAEVMVDPRSQGLGVGKALYAARRDLCRSLNLLRIRAGARLRGYHAYADVMTPEAYVHAILDRRLTDPTLSFQIKQGFRVLAVVRNYLRHDPDSHGHAAVIEWINHRVAKPRDYRHRPAEWARHRKVMPKV